MSRLVKLIKNKIATGAVIGALLGGATPTVIQSYSLPENASITTPLTLDNINVYGVTTKKFKLKKLSNNESKVTEEPTVKEYKDIKEIINYNPNNSLNTNNIDLIISSPWILNNDSTILRIKYHYSNINDNITSKEILNIIEIFKSGKIEQIVSNSNIDLKYDYKEYNESNEVIENYNYIAELTIKTIDYNDIKVIKQDKIDNIIETTIAIPTALIGLRLGIYAGNIYENSNNYIKNKIKLKKFNRK